MTPNYIEAAYQTYELHKLSLIGMEDSLLAEIIRDASDIVWNTLSEEEKTALRTFSETLNEIDSLQQRLLEAGVLSEIKPPITDLKPYQNRQTAPIQGEPLSTTVLRERR